MSSKLTLICYHMFLNVLSIAKMEFIVSLKPSIMTFVKIYVCENRPKWDFLKKINKVKVH